MRCVTYTRAVSGSLELINSKGIIPGIEPEKSYVSITEQNEKLKQYLKDKDWQLVGRYSDRKKDKDEDQEFLKMSQDGINREFDILVCCSLMFLGNSFSAAKQILGSVFFPAGIHFAVVEDDFCSIGKTDDEVNAYLEACKTVYRKKISTANCSNYLESCKYKYYGYIWQPDGSLVIDEEPAEVIRKIFALYLQGMNMREIAEALTADGVETTLDYRARKNGHAYCYQGKPWTKATIAKMLGSEIYSGKWIRKIGQETTTIDVPAIVSKADFAKIQKMRGDKRNSGNSHNVISQSLFSGMIVDDESEEALVVESKRTNGKDIYRTDETTRRDVIFDQGKHIRSDQVLEAAVQALLEEKDQAEKTAAYLSSDEGKLHKENQMASIQTEMKGIFSKMIRVDQQLHLNPDDSAKLAEMNQLQKEMQNQEGKMEEVEKRFSLKNPWIALYRNLTLPEEYSRGYFRKMLEQIRVVNFQDVLVKLRYEEWKIDFWTTCPKVQEG